MRTVRKPYTIYLLFSDDYWYVGSTTRGAITRRQDHFLRTRSGAARLQGKLEELGTDAFTMTVLSVGVGHPIEAEGRWYDYLLATDSRSTLNYRRPGGWPEWTPETRAKASRSQRGRPMSPETRAKISAAITGIKRSPETRAKVSLVNQNMSPETRAKISASKKGKPGYIPTAETRAKMRAAQLGRRRTPEQNANNAAAQTGKTLSAEHKAKIHNTNKGRKLAPFTDEHRAKLSAAALARHARERAEKSA